MTRSGGMPGGPGGGPGGGATAGAARGTADGAAPGASVRTGAGGARGEANGSVRGGPEAVGAADGRSAGADSAPAPPVRTPAPGTPASRVPVHVSDDGLPGWLAPVADAARTVRPEELSSFLPPDGGGGRPAAVLILFGDGEDGPELLLTERASSLRSHAGQPSFPGGSLDPEDGDPAGEGPLRAALREAQEETGLDPAGVQVFSVLPRLYIPVSGFVVSPVLGWWRERSPVGVVDPAETARVFSVSVADLTDPANRAMAVHPRGHLGPAFLVGSALVWGFTAGVIDRILHLAGWERPWDRERRVPLDWHA